MQTKTERTTNRGPAASSTSRRTVASYPTYAEAERAVDYLSDHGFPVEHVAIVGRGLKFVEQVTGRMTYLDATLRGATVGGLTGLLIGWLFAVFNWFDPIIGWGWLVLDALWVGLLVGALFGLLSHVVTGGRRDFASVPAMEADVYEVVVDEHSADRAEQMIRGLSGQQSPAPLA